MQQRHYDQSPTLSKPRVFAPCQKPRTGSGRAQYGQKAKADKARDVAEKEAALLKAYVGLPLDKDKEPLPATFHDDPQAAEVARTSIVTPAERSPKAKSKDLFKRTEDGMPVHSFQTLLKDLATLTRNEVRVGEQTLQMLATPTPVQQRALQLLQVSTGM